MGGGGFVIPAPVLKLPSWSSSAPGTSSPIQTDKADFNRLVIRRIEHIKINDMVAISHLLDEYRRIVSDVGSLPSLVHYNDDVEIHVILFSMLHCIPLAGPVRGRGLYDTFCSTFPYTLAYEDFKKVLYSLPLEVTGGYDGLDIPLAHTPFSRGLYALLGDVIFNPQSIHRYAILAGNGVIKTNNRVKVKDETGDYQTTFVPCGTVTGWKACKKGHYTAVMTAQCNRRDCPIDYHKWAADAADRIENSFLGYIDALRDAGYRGKVYDPWSAYISCDEKEIGRLIRETNEIIATSDKYTLFDFHEVFYGLFYDTVKAICKTINVTGGKLFYHPYRFKDDECKRIANQMATDKNNEINEKFKNKGRKGAGPQIYNKYTVLYDKSNYIEDFLKFSPHMHVIGFGQLLKMEKDHRGREQIPGFPGWVYHNDGPRPLQSKTANGKSPLWRTVCYILTHTGIIPGKDAYRSIGNLHSSKFRKYRNCDQCGEQVYGSKLNECPKCGSKLTVTEYEVCPKCGEQMYYADCTDAGEILHIHDDEQVTVEKTYWFYEFVGPPPARPF